MTSEPSPALPTLQQVAELVGEVLMTPVTEGDADAELVADLGAESIDFLDLVFRIEDLIGTRIAPERWWTYVDEEIETPEGGRGITVAFVHQFTVHMVQSADRQDP